MQVGILVQIINPNARMFLATSRICYFQGNNVNGELHIYLEGIPGYFYFEEELLVIQEQEHTL